MKKILITGADSYIGTSFEKYIKNNFPEEYSVDTIDMKDGSWHEKNFSGYDSILHVAGIAHSDSGKISPEKEKLYYGVNSYLAAETAEKAKSGGVSQFIFMSSSIVYGESAPIGKEKKITEKTLPSPANCYGESKLRAEKLIGKLQDGDFNVVIIRTPMVFGKGCKGNYRFLSKISGKLPFFPYVNNERSMIYTENLCEFIRLMICNNEKGIFWPQNGEYSNTSKMVKSIATANGGKIRLVPGFSTLLSFFARFIKMINKAFGNLTYDMALSGYKEEYRICSLEEAIQRTESKD